MLNCKQATEACSDEMERQLRLGERIALRAHLLMCSGCTEYRKQLKVLRRVMQAYADGQATSDETRPDGSP